MQKSQREEYNHALEYVIEKANELSKPLIVFFGLTDDFLDADERHYYFMLEGLQEVKESLEKRNIGFVIRKQFPVKGVIDMAEDASLVIVDRGYLKIQREWRDEVAKNIDCPLVQVESDVVVPVEKASGKEEYAARTIRPKINKKLDKYPKPLERRDIEKSSIGFDFDSLPMKNIENIITKLDLGGNIQRVDSFIGGSSNAKALLNDFIENKLGKYHKYSNDPSKDYLSNLSPYLHFGQVSLSMLR